MDPVAGYSVSGSYSSLHAAWAAPAGRKGREAIGKGRDAIRKGRETIGKGCEAI